jgi:hypothetical protein
MAQRNPTICRDGEATARAAHIVELCDALTGKGFLTYAEQATELNRQGERTDRGAKWTAQSVYLCCRLARPRRMHSREVHELVDGRWRHRMREKILELKRLGATRYADIAKSLNGEGVTTRLGQAWSEQSVYRLMRSVGLQTGKSGRRRHDE